MKSELAEVEYKLEESRKKRRAIAKQKHILECKQIDFNKAVDKATKKLHQKMAELRKNLANWREKYFDLKAKKITKQ